MQIVKQNITHQVIDYIKKNIEQQTWQIGEKIPSENMLTKELGVSRASVRVAIQQFIAIGALESVHGKGTFVKTNSLDAFANSANNITREDCDDIRKVLEFRRVVETECSYLAALHASAQTLENLKSHLQQMISCVGKSEEFVCADLLFHEEISQASENPLLEKSLREVFRQTAKNHQQINEIFGFKDGVYYHTVILKAIEKRDAKTAKKLMYEHLQQAIDRLEVN